MSYFRHNAIVVTSWHPERIRQAHQRACELLGPLVSPPLASSLNGYWSFFVAPDGSKEGWDESDRHDQLRDVFVAWLDARRNEEGASTLDWAEIQYGDRGEGDGRPGTYVTRHSDEPPEGGRPADDLAGESHDASGDEQGI